MAQGPQLVTLIPVRKMDRAIKFYTKVAGAKVLMRADGPMKDFWASVKVGGCEVWFVAPEERESRKLAYTTLVVKNIKTFVAKLKKSGVKFEKAVRMNADTKVDGPIASDMMGSSAFFKDSEGNLLMVWQNSSMM